MDETTANEILKAIPPEQLAEAVARLQREKQDLSVKEEQKKKTLIANYEDRIVLAQAETLTMKNEYEKQKKLVEQLGYPGISQSEFLTMEKIAAQIRTEESFLQTLFDHNKRSFVLTVLQKTDIIEKKAKIDLKNAQIEDISGSSIIENFRKMQKFFTLYPTTINFDAKAITGDDKEGILSYEEIKKLCMKTANMYLAYTQAIGELVNNADTRAAALMLYYMNDETNSLVEPSEKEETKLVAQVGELKSQLESLEKEIVKLKKVEVEKVEGREEKKIEDEKEGIVQKAESILEDSEEQEEEEKPPETENSSEIPRRSRAKKY